jgi:hypothetical protein
MLRKGENRKANLNVADNAAGSIIEELHTDLKDTTLRASAAENLGNLNRIF